MDNILIRKLSNYVDLSEDDKQALDSLVQEPNHFSARTDIVHEGDPTGDVYLILTGWACRYKILPGGQRQIVAYFIPSDICDQRIFILRRMDHSIRTVTPTTVAVIPKERMIGLTDDHPRIARALWWSTLVDEAITREWVLNVGQRSAIQRLGHLICEMFVRLRAVGLTEGTSYEFPVIQAEVADTTGLSVVHANRTLQELRENGLIVWKGRRLTILDLNRLTELSMFNPNYLHLEGEGNEPGSRENPDAGQITTE